MVKPLLEKDKDLDNLALLIGVGGTDSYKGDFTRDHDDFLEMLGGRLDLSLEDQLKKIRLIRDQAVSKSGVRINEEADNLIQFDRRRSIRDRRKLYTFIANDRRNGIADRRKQIPK